MTQVESIQLDDLAQNIMDAYYGAEKADEDFFGIYHFKYMASMFYHGLLQDEWEQSYKMNLAEGQRQATINEEYYIEEPVTVTWDKKTGATAQLKHKIFSFKYDKSVTGILTLRSPDFNLVRTTASEYWKNSLLPGNKFLFWYPVFSTGRIHFEGSAAYGLKNATILYIPQLVVTEDVQDFIISGTMASQIFEAVLRLAKGASAGNVIDMTDNQNNNKPIETELAELLARRRAKA